MYNRAEYLKITEAVCDLYREGYSLKEVSAASGIGIPTVTQIVRDHGLMRPRGGNPRKQMAKQELVPTKLVEELPAPAAPVAGIGVVCLACGNTDHLEGSAFCCRCGTRLESEAKRLKRALRNLYSMAHKAAADADIAKLVQEDHDLLLAFVNAHAKIDCPKTEV